MYKYAYIHISSLPLSVPVIIRQPVYRVEGKFCLRHGTRIHLRHKDCGFSITSKLVLLHFSFFEKKKKKIKTKDKLSGRLWYMLVQN